MTCIELKSFVTAMMAEAGHRHTGDSYHLPLVTTYPQHRHHVPLQRRHHVPSQRHHYVVYPRSDVTT